ncbi:ImcF-related family protein [Pectobacterium sp. B1J-3]|uniref:ImcF-related family protein n=1 Tax=Pectobacterium sp. B1J-3 TaxID=3385371 RepID=UPI003905C85F
MSKYDWRRIFVIFFIVLVVAVCIVTVFYLYADGWGLKTIGSKLLVATISFLTIVGLLFLLTFGVSENKKLLRKSTPLTSSMPEKKKRHELTNSADYLGDACDYLRTRYGRFWKRHVRILLVVGEPAMAEALAPGLTVQQWLEGSKTLLVWGGEVNHVDADQLTMMRQLRRYRPLDGVIWAVSAAQRPHAAEMDNARRQLDKYSRLLGWQAPVWLWEIQHSEWPQGERETQTVGCLLPSRCTAETVRERLLQLVPRLTQSGIHQMLQQPEHDFLFRLAHHFENGGVARLTTMLAPLLSGTAALPLRGLLFSLPVAAPSGAAPHSWYPDPVWQGVLTEGAGASGKRLGLPWEKTTQWGLITFSLLWAIGSLVSYVTNRHDMQNSAELAQTAVGTERTLGERLLSLQSLQQEMARLKHDAQSGGTWYSRFGLNQSQAQLTVLWPWYFTAQQALIRDTAAQRLSGALRKMVNLPAASRQRATVAQAGYEQLKAYLMMAYPEKAEPAFLTKALLANLPSQPGVPDGVWRGVSPALLGFYAENLSAHPAWRIEPDRALIGEARQLLLNQIGVSNAESTLYQRVLQQVSQNYADLTLAQMVEETDASRLFTTDSVVPGMFTRQAWEEQVEEAIDAVVSERREEIDWVLSENEQGLSENVSPEQLKNRLTTRYFNDFSGAWISFLNDLRWNSTATLSDVAEQLTLMADTRQSPLIALMNTLAWQGKTGQQGPALTDSLMQSAQGLLHKKKKQIPMMAQKQGPTGPLDESFGPLLALIEGTAGGQGNANLSLQTYLTRVTQLRLKLQQVTNAVDPQAMTQALAQTVFQGKAVDLTETRDYGSLIAASLGGEWGEFGYTVFVQPLEQSWQQVLQPASNSLNGQWQRAIVNDWNHAFSGRYPFADTTNDASLPLLAQYLRADSGRIEQFLKTQLSGMLHKEGNQWVPDVINTQGLTFNPRFLAAINQLSALSDTLLAQGDAGVRFELMPRAASGVVQTVLTVDGQTLTYFNQQESWQRLSWPGETYKPGSLLNWQANNTGTRLYADEEGVWGWIRLLEKAKVEQIDSSRYRLMWRTPDHQTLTYILRTELGEGPLSVLKLRNFTLPTRIFTTDAATGE